MFVDKETTSFNHANSSRNRQMNCHHLVVVRPSRHLFSINWHSVDVHRHSLWRLIICNCLPDDDSVIFNCRIVVNASTTTVCVHGSACVISTDLRQRVIHLFSFFAQNAPTRSIVKNISGKSQCNFQSDKWWVEKSFSLASIWMRMQIE